MGYLLEAAPLMLVTGVVVVSEVKSKRLGLSLGSLKGSWRVMEVNHISVDKVVVEFHSEEGDNLVEGRGINNHM